MLSKAVTGSHYSVLLKTQQSRPPIDLNGTRDTHMIKTHQTHENWLVQINDRYEFPDELDLDVEDGKFLAPDADRNVRNLYKLHSVLVHSGGVHGGHYYAYIRPATQQWLKFDDEKVTVLGCNQHVTHGKLACWLHEEIAVHAWPVIQSKPLT